jgi:hypothetical protein
MKIEIIKNKLIVIWLNESKNDLIDLNSDCYIS